MRHIPNLICILRILLIWPILAALQDGNYDFAFILFTIAAVSDGLDGYLAKHFGWISSLGKVLDPLADKLLLVCVFVVGTWMGLVPRWLTVAAVARDMMIGLGALTYRIWFGPLQGRPTVLSKINTLVQLMYLLGVMTHAALGFPPVEMLGAMAVLVFGTTVLSGVDYITTFTRRAWVSSSPAG